MKAARRALWLPPLCVGVATAASVSTSTALLLYRAEGMGRALLAIAAITSLSLALGFWMGVNETEQEQVPSTARWWIGLLVALVLAAGFSGFWDAFRGFGATPASQGAGLALMTALPTYFAGGVLGRIGSFAETLAQGVKGQVALGAVLGVALGAGGVMAALGRPLLAVTAFLGSATLASLGARIQGWIFDRVPRRRLVLRDAGAPGLRFEVWHTAVSNTSLRLLIDQGEPRVQDPPARGSWQEGVSLATAGRAVFFVGAGAWFDAGEASWTVYEPDPGTVSLCMRGLGWDPARLVDTPVPERGEGVVVVERGCLDGVLGTHHSLYDYIEALRSAGAEQMWIGGVRTALPEELVDVTHRGGLHLRAFSGKALPQEGPPRIGSRWEHLWCFQKEDVWPVRVGGLALDPLEP